MNSTKKKQKCLFFKLLTILTMKGCSKLSINFLSFTKYLAKVFSLSTLFLDIALIAYIFLLLWTKETELNFPWPKNLIKFKELKLISVSWKANFFIKYSLVLLSFNITWNSFLDKT